MDFNIQTSLFDLLPHLQQRSSAIAALCILPFVLTWLFTPKLNYNKANVVRVGKSNLQAWLTWDSMPNMSLGKYMTDGYNKLIKPSGTAFAIPMCGMENVILPPKYLKNLKGEERSDLSLCQAFEDMFNMTITTGPAGRHDEVEIEVVAKYINPRLAAFLPHMVSQTAFAFDHVVGQSSSWKKFPTVDFAFELVFAETARVLVGEELCRDPSYLKAIVDYSKSFLMSGFMWPLRPPHIQILRKWFYWAGTWGLRRDIARAFKLIIPVIEKRAKYLEGLKKDKKEPDDAHMDMITGLLSMDIPQPEEATSLRHAHRVLHISFAASAVSSALMMHMLHTVLSMPHIIDELRTDVKNALSKHGDWTDQALIDMVLLDSFIRELLRLYPPSIFTGQRTITSPEYRFSPTFSLPRGSRIAFPTYEIHTDPDNYESPLTFNPYRFMGSKPDHSDHVQGTRITETYLSFGYGKQACPGRFLAVKQLKLIMAKFFLEYEVQWAGGMDKGPKKLKRQVVEGQIFPDLSTNVEIRKRATA